MKYQNITDIYKSASVGLEKLIDRDKTLENDYYIKGAKNILTNKVNIFIDCLNFSEIDEYFRDSLKKNLRVLDLGCGLGDKSIVLKNIFPNADIYGLETTTNDDPSHKNNPPYKTFSRIYPLYNQEYGINLGTYNGYDIHFPDEHFDIAILYAVIEHISPENRSNFIRSVAKKVKKDGHIVITRCPRSLSLTEFVARKFNLGAHEWVLAKNDLTGLFEEDIFEIEVIKTISNVPANPQKITNKISGFLITLDWLLTAIRWPFASDYFLIAKVK